MPPASPLSAPESTPASCRSSTGPDKSPGTALRRRRRLAVGIALGLAGSCLLAACGSSTSSTAGKPSQVLHMAFQADMGTPDPDIFYATEGLEVTNSVYEGLLRYSNNSTHVAGDLASTWSVSTDRRTYTFRLRHGVRFHDGTAFDASAVRFSFARRTAVNQGPAYMLVHVSSVATPDPYTVIVHLNEPVSAFLDYLASPFGPKMVSPTAITKHSVGGDHAQKWLLTHDAGSGPFEFASFQPSVLYVLDRFAGWWGSKPAVAQIRINIVPLIATQQLEFQQGQLDVITHGLLTSNFESLRHQAGFSGMSYPTELKAIMDVNPHRGPFVSQAARAALEQAIDKRTLTSTVFGGEGTPSTQLYPAGELAAAVTTSQVPYDPSVLRKLVPGLPTKKVDIAYDSTDPRNQRFAELIGAELDAVGMRATSRPIPLSQMFELAKAPARGPDILVQTTNPDAAHPDTWARIYMSKGGGANYLQCFVPAADALLDKGLAATAPDAVARDYGAAGNLLVKSGCYIDVADVNDDIVARSGLAGIYHVPSMPWAIGAETLTLRG
jgi:peptide/nickel transport system substrate-binding protein